MPHPRVLELLARIACLITEFEEGDEFCPSVDAEIIIDCNTFMWNGTEFEHLEDK